jgi:hypothetical protein
MREDLGAMGFASDVLVGKLAGGPGREPLEQL